MKHNTFIIAVLSLVVLFSITAFAHPGDTDSNGGHYDLSTGKYHYHHGYPAHQHTNGQCPYKISEEDYLHEIYGTDVYSEIVGNNRYYETIDEYKVIREKEALQKRNRTTVIVFTGILAVTAGMFIYKKRLDAKNIRTEQHSGYVPKKESVEQIYNTATNITKAYMELHKSAFSHPLSRDELSELLSLNNQKRRKPSRNTRKL